MKRISTICAAGLMALAFILTARQAAAQAEKSRFVQDRFAIGQWVDPPADEKMEERYKELAEANFTIVNGCFGATTPEQIKRQLELCEKYDLKALVVSEGIEPDKLPDGPACWGYQLQDEPNAKDFPKLGARVAAIRKARPGKLAYINLFPEWVTLGAIGTGNYEEYMQRFLKEVDPDVLSMDHYPVFTPVADGREGYCRTLAVFRRYALQHGLPFWNFLYSMPTGTLTDPTEAQIRWQAYTSLAYGAKGILYFCYQTPVAPMFVKGGAIIDRTGRRTRHYEQAKRINAELRNLGPTLMQLTNLRTFRVAPYDITTEAVVETPDQEHHPHRDRPAQRLPDRQLPAPGRAARGVVQ